MNALPAFISFCVSMMSGGRPSCAFMTCSGDNLSLEGKRTQTTTHILLFAKKLLTLQTQIHTASAQQDEKTAPHRHIALTDNGSGVDLMPHLRRTRIYI